MYTKTFTVLLLLFVAFGNPIVLHICKAQIKIKELRKIELSSIDIEWSNGDNIKLPSSARSDIDEYYKDGRFCFVDLNWDGTKEIIVENKNGGSGGMEYEILQLKNKKWRVIGACQGGFVLSGVDIKDMYYRIICYNRSGGETYQNTFEYSKEKYILISQVLLPRIISRSSWWDIFWDKLNLGGRDANLK